MCFLCPNTDKPLETKAVSLQGCFTRTLNNNDNKRKNPKQCPEQPEANGPRPAHSHLFQQGEIAHPSSAIATHSCTSTPPRSLPLLPASPPGKRDRNSSVVTWGFSFFIAQGESLQEHGVHAPTTSLESGIIRI